MQVQKHLFLIKRGLQHNVLFINLCFAKCVKLSFFAYVLPIFVVFSKHCKNRYVCTCLKANTYKKYILRGYFLVQVGVIVWSKLGAF